MAFELMVEEVEVAAELSPDRTGRTEEPAHAFQPGVGRELIERVISRPARDWAFRREILRNYGARCAISRHRFVNAENRAEVEAAHIRSVQSGGPDLASNGIALSRTYHWLFDNG